MPRLWNETIEAHRAAVRDATLDAAAALAAEHGVLAITMSKVAEAAGIGRATLYKYFPDIEAILVAWHEREISSHLAQLHGIANSEQAPAQRLREVLATYASIGFEHHGSELAAGLHQGEHVIRAHEHLARFVTHLIEESVEDGSVRGDVAPRELAAYCLHAVGAAAAMRSKAAARRLVAVTMDGLAPN